MREEEPILGEECPFCRTVIKSGATVCPSCNAEKKNSAGCGCALIVGILLSGLLALGLLSDGYIWPALGAAGLTLVLIAIFPAMTRWQWVRTRNV